MNLSESPVSTFEQNLKCVIFLTISIACSILVVPRLCWILPVCIAVHSDLDESLTCISGKDASTNFEEIGHSDDARQKLKEYYVGDLSEVGY